MSPKKDEIRSHLDLHEIEIELRGQAYLIGRMGHDPAPLFPEKMVEIHEGIGKTIGHLCDRINVVNLYLQQMEIRPREKNEEIN